jgi:DMATS type aromatic prenyltransferase
MTNSENIATVSESIDRSENSTVDTVSNLEQRISIDQQSQVGFNPERLVPNQTYVECGVEKLTALCQSVGLSDQTAQIIAVFRGITSSWGNKQVGDKSGWQSDVSDDCAPFEFSLALDPDRIELRILIEAQGQAADLQSNWQAGLELNQYLAKNYQVNLDRFEQIADLYTPTNAAAKFSMWHAVCFYPDKAPTFKIYLNPQAQSRSRSAAVIEESMVRLGFPNAWTGLAEIAAQRGPEQDEFVYFSLDLSAHNQSRVKIYLRHYDATSADLEKAFSLAQNYVLGDVTEFCQTLIQNQDSFASKPMASCFAFVEGNNDRPIGATLCVPIGYYVSNDQVVSEHLYQYLSQHNLQTETYTMALKAFATRSLDSGCGMHSHLSLRRENQQRRVTVYLNPEINCVRSQSIELKPTEIETIIWRSPLSIEEKALAYDESSIVDHPFLQRFQREPMNMTNLWLLFANGRKSVVAPFVRRLASTIDRSKNEEIRSILTKQLNEELGNGDPSQVHLVLFDKLFLALNSYKPAFVSEQMLEPGHELGRRLDALFFDPNPDVGVGAAIVMEIRGKQIDQFMENEFVTRTTMDRSSLEWLHLHAEIEIEHADESLDLARLIISSQGDEVAAQNGAKMTADAMWSFCDGMYRVCFMQTTPVV